MWSPSTRRVFYCLDSLVVLSLSLVVELKPNATRLGDIMGGCKKGELVCLKRLESARWYSGCQTDRAGAPSQVQMGVLLLHLTHPTHLTCASTTSNCL